MVTKLRMSMGHFEKFKMPSLHFWYLARGNDEADIEQLPVAKGTLKMNQYVLLLIFC